MFWNVSLERHYTLFYIKLSSFKGPWLNLLQIILWFSSNVLFVLQTEGENALMFCSDL